MTPKSIYDFLPVFLQNLAISIYGLNLRRCRYGADYSKVLKDIDLSTSPTNNALKDTAIGFLNEAISNVSAYQKALSGSGPIDMREFSNISALLNKFPITLKKNLKENPSLYISRNPSGKILKNNTSGSTGSPLEIATSLYSLQFNYAFFHHFLSQVGVSEFDRSATFAGRMIIPKRQRSAVFWRKNYAMKTLLLSSYHISAKNAEGYLGAIEEWNPTYIDSYPSAVYELALFLKKLAIKPRLKLRAIVTSSETLFPYQREVIEEVFGCRVFDHYGCAEQAVVAFQVKGEKGAPYEIPAQYCLVEVLNDSDSPVLPGEEGRLICTNLFNRTMPLIRYDIGDRAVLREYHSGTYFAKSLASISGRVDDVISTKEGMRVGRLDPLFKGLKGIKEAQIVQHSFELIEIRLVPIGGVKIDEDRLIRLLRERVGETFNIKISYFDSIPRNVSGKFRSVVSKV